jgi:hypothetical protein
MLAALLFTSAQMVKDWIFQASAAAAAAPTCISLSELFKPKFTLGQVVKFSNEFGINFAVSKSEHQEFTHASAPASTFGLCVVCCAARRWATFYGAADKLSDTVRERSTRGDQNPACHSSTLWPNNICCRAYITIGFRPHIAGCRVLALNLSGIRICQEKKVFLSNERDKK